jgi:phosphoglycerate dehydrogenase-like enzyme
MGRGVPDRALPSRSVRVVQHPADAVPVIVAIGPAGDLVAQRLAAFGSYVEVAAGDADAIARHLPSAVAIAARASAVLDAALIEAAPRLKVIGRSGVGVDQVDVDAASARGIPVVVTPNANARAVAEGAFALILHLVKRLGPFTELVRDGGGIGARTYRRATSTRRRWESSATGASGGGSPRSAPRSA